MADEKRYKHCNPQFIEANKYCGIQKGISKAELMVKMRDCIPEYFKEVRRNANKDLHIEELPPMSGTGGETEGIGT
jgi:hypothetical protein